MVALPNDLDNQLPAIVQPLPANAYPSDALAENWVWLLNKSERAFNKLQERVAAASRADAALENSQLSADEDDLAQLDKFTCFVPRAVLEAIVDGKINAKENSDIIIERCSGALVFCDASGFTAVTEAFNREPNGAERLGNVINDFFTSLIQIINFWGGDIIKFAGDAVTIVWGVDDLDNANEEDCGYYIDAATACKLACQCCLDLHRNLNGFPAGIEERTFTLHIGVGFGLITILQVGGTLDRWDFVVAGPPVTQISIAEPLASSGDTVLSPEVVDTVGSQVITEEIKDNHHKLLRIAGEATAAPPPLERIHLKKNAIRLLRRFIPPPIYQRLSAGFTAFTNELRQLSVIFVSVKGLDVDTNIGSIKANALMQHCQKSAYLLEGSVNKLSVDDKGVVVLIMFGLPPVYHMDDPIRSVLCGLRVAEGLKTLGLGCGIGIATGRVWIGTVGCDIRKEYTALGDTVNLAARLMGKAQINEVLCDKTTQALCSHAIEFQPLPPVRMKGKADLVPMFRPPGRLKRYDEQRFIDPAVLFWPAWRQASILRQVVFPLIKFRPFVDGFDAVLPPLPDPLEEDKEVTTHEDGRSESSAPSASRDETRSEASSHPDGQFFGPQYPWDIREPWVPTLRSAIDLGGVMVIKGREVQGSLELVEYLKDLAEAAGHHVFVCSNTPESTYLPVANVALLGFRKLCTEVVYRWRNSPVRKQKGYTVVDEKNSIYSLTKELTHPMFHWRLSAMKAVVKGLVLPKELPQNQPATQWNHELPSTPQPEINQADFGPTRPAPPGAREILKVEDASGVHQAAVVPAVCSLINGYTMNEKTLIIFKFSTAQMDADSWKALTLLANMAVLRRRRRLELECETLRKWRKNHSWNCAWCKGLCPTETADDRKGMWTTRCRPPVVTYFPPFLLAVVCSPDAEEVSDMSKISAWARECGLYMNLGKLSRSETHSFLSFYFKTSKRRIPPAVVDYVHRVSAGYLNYVALTARQLLHHDAVETRAVQTVQPAAATTSADVSTSEEDVCDYETVQERAIARNAVYTQEERKMMIKRRRLFPTTSGVSVGFQFNGNHVAQLRGCIVHRDIVFDGDIDKGRGVWYRKQQTVQKRIPDHFKLPGPLEYASRELDVGVRSRKYDSILGTPMPSDNERIQRLIEPSDLRKVLVIIKDLRLIPYIAQLRAATMMLIEALKPEEQLVAKCASVFTVAFCFYELCAVAPKAITLGRLEMIVESLLRRELLEICDPPADSELADLNIASVVKALDRHSRDEMQSGAATDEDSNSQGSQLNPVEASLTLNAQKTIASVSPAENTHLMAEAQEAEEELLRHASLYARKPAPTMTLSDNNDNSEGSSLKSTHRASVSAPMSRDPAYGTLRFDDQIIRPTDKDISTFNRTDVQGTKSDIPICQTSSALTALPTRQKTLADDDGHDIGLHTSRVYTHRTTGQTDRALDLSDSVHFAALPSDLESDQSDAASDFWRQQFEVHSESSIKPVIKNTDRIQRNSLTSSTRPNPKDITKSTSTISKDSSLSDPQPKLRIGVRVDSANGVFQSIPPAAPRVRINDTPPDVTASGPRKHVMLNVNKTQTDASKESSMGGMSSLSWECQNKSSLSTFGGSPGIGHRYRAKIPATSARLRSAMFEYDNCSGDDQIIDQTAFIHKTVESLQGKTLYGIKADGVPVFYRFTSTAYQHVLADLLTSDERNFIAHLARMVVTMRKHYGLPFMVLQVQLRGTWRETE